MISTFKSVMPLGTGCGQTFTLYDAYLLHYAVAHGYPQFEQENETSRFPCDVCKKIFKTEQGHADHKKQMHPISSTFGELSRCGICKMLFRSQLACEQHHMIKHALPCTICERSFTTEKGVAHHRKAMHPESSIHQEAAKQDNSLKRTGTGGHCAVCRIIFMSQDAFEQHQGANHVPPCLICLRSFKTEKGAADHKMAKHPELPIYKEVTKTDNSPTYKETTWYCAVCRMNFRSQDGFERHQRTKHTFPCTICKRSFTTEKGAADHKMAKHPEPSATWYCSVCERTFESLEEMEDHNWELHHGCVRYHLRRATATFTCITCNRTFDAQTELDSHIEGAHTKPPVPCSIPPGGAWYCSACDEMFTTQVEVENHNTEVHAGYRIFCLNRVWHASACVVCNRRFNNFHQLATHLANSFHGLPRLSKLEKARWPRNAHLQCCGKTFSSDEDVRKHTFVAHIRPWAPKFRVPAKAVFACVPCSITFVHESQLDTHNLDVHNRTTDARGPLCLCCHKTFDVDEIDAHYKAEHYPMCYICNIVFPFEHESDTHDRDVHGIVNKTANKIKQEPNGPQSITQWVQNNTSNVVRRKPGRPNNTVIINSSGDDESDDASGDSESVASSGYEGSDNPQGDSESEGSCDSSDMETDDDSEHCAEYNGKPTGKWGDPNSGLPCCKACDKTFWGKYGLTKHKRAIHGPLIPPSQIPPFSCIECRRAYADEARLIDHNRRMHGPSASRRRNAYSFHESGMRDIYGDQYVEESEETSSDEDSFDEFYLTDDSNTDVTPWPRYGEIGYLRCPGRDLACREKFRWGSDLLEHIESEECVVLERSLKLPDLFGVTLGLPHARLYTSTGWLQGFYMCPECPKGAGNRFEELSDLFRHAESESCGLSVGDKYLVQVEDGINKYAEKNCKRVGRFTW